MKQTLETVPQHVNINIKISECDLRNNVFDGTYMRRIINQHDSVNYLAFCIYCDEVEFTNAIGSNRTIHKLSMLKFINDQ